MTVGELHIGTKVREKASGIVFLVADHGHMGYEGTTLVTDNAIAYACIDASEPNNPDGSIKLAGNNYYPHSNIHQWLNSNENDWYKPAHEFDNPPDEQNVDPGRQDSYEVPFYSEEARFLGAFNYEDKPGFLICFSDEFVEKLYVSKVPCFAEPQPGVVHYGPPDPVYLDAKVFLMSLPELGYEAERTGTEGYRFKLFNDPVMRVCAPTAKAINRSEENFNYKDCAFSYYTRTPMAKSKNFTMTYAAEHKMGDTNPSALRPSPSRAVSGIRPAMNIHSDTEITESCDEFGVYDFVFGGK